MPLKEWSGHKEDQNEHTAPSLHLKQHGPEVTVTLMRGLDLNALIH